jgi:hypothetical protein
MLVLMLADAHIGQTSNHHMRHFIVLIIVRVAGTTGESLKVILTIP